MANQDSSSSRFTNPGVHGFGKVFFYCLDGVKETKLQARHKNPDRFRPSLHDVNVWDVQSTLGKSTDFEVINVLLRPTNDATTLQNYFEEQLSIKQHDDLLTFYYYGLAGDKDEDYSWKFDGPRHVFFNAYDIFKLCRESGLTCLFLLDCDIQINWDGTCKLEAPKGHVSILARGGELKNYNNEVLDDADSFTGAFTRKLRAIADGTEKRKYILRTIPQMLGLALSSPTYKVHRIQSIFKQSTDMPTMNIVVDLERIREKRESVPGCTPVKIEFFLHVTTKGNKGSGQATCTTGL